MMRIPHIQWIACFAYLAVLLITPTTAQSAESKFADQEAKALKAVDAYIAAFNARDPEAVAKTLHYPHMRIDGKGNPTVLTNWKDYADVIDFDLIVKRDGWHHSILDSKKVIQSGTDKVHVVIQFTRYDADNEPILTRESFYVVTNQNGEWKIAVRSSFLEQVESNR